ncbi:MAG: acyl-CoA dehydrogenase C-terminal domain-containing protein, partial [Sphingomonadaceae bacterium]
VEKLTAHLLEADVDDRLAASYPYLTMVSVMTCGWLMERQGRVAQAMLDAGEGDPTFLRAKTVTARYYLTHLVGEALGLAGSVTAGAEGLYDLSAEELAA